MSTRLKQIAATNQRIAEDGRYQTPEGTEVEVGTALAAAVAGTRSYAADALADVGGHSVGHDSVGHDSVGRNGDGVTALEVTGADTIAAARQLIAAGEERVAALNFASARNPGGGYVNGAKAQEEDVCRKSLLYSCLLTAPDYYEAHRATRDPFYSHRLIYSPGVPVIRDEHDELTAPVITLDVVTCAAPNAGVILRDQPERADEIPQQLTARAGAVLAAAAGHGARALVLGAWGCGVFRNDPRQVAAAFRTHLVGGGFERAFTRVVFAVVDRSPQQRNLRAFQDAFELRSRRR